MGYDESQYLRILIPTVIMAFFLRMSYELVRNPALPLYAKDVLGVNLAELGFVMAASTITGIFIKFPAGALSDKYGRKKMLMIACSVFMSGPFLYLLAQDKTHLGAIRFYHGLATATSSPALAALVAGISEKRRGQVMSMYMMGFYMGYEGGPLLGGVLVQHFGYAVTFLTSGLCAIAGSATLLTIPFHILPETAKKGVKKKSIFSKEAMRTLVSTRGVAIACFANIAVWFVTGSFEGFIAVYSRDVAMLAVSLVGVVTGADFLSKIAIQPFAGGLSDKYGRKPMMIFGLVVTSIGIIMVPVSMHFLWLVMCSMLVGLGVATETAASAYVGDVATDDQKGAALGLFGSSKDIGHASGPIVAGLLLLLLGYQTTFWVATVPAFLMILVIILLMREKRQGV